MVGAFMREIAVRQTAQLVIDKRQQLIQGLAIADAPVLKQLGDLTGRSLHVFPLNAAISRTA